MSHNIYIEHFLYVEEIELLVYISLILGTVIFLYGIWRAYNRWTYGGERPSIDNLGLRINNFIKYGLLQKKVLYRPYEGVMHLLIYIGFIILLIGTVLRALEADLTLKLFGIRLLTDGPYLLFKLALNIAGILAIIGILMAFARRIFFKSRYLPNDVEDNLILFILLVILSTGYVLDTISTAAYRMDWINGWDPVGITLVKYFSSLPDIQFIYKTIWAIHLLLAVFMVAYLPYTKLFHIIAGGVLNTFFARTYAPQEFQPIPDIDEVVEKGGTPGAGKLMDFSWKQRLDYDACIKCARCTDNCPAALSGKPLSPMDLMLSLRRLMDRGIFDDELVPKYIEDDVIWSCVTCGACVYQCPMLIHHVESIVDIRRYLLGKGEEVPEEVLQVSYNLMRYGNPMGSNPADREQFIQELVDETGVEIAEGGKKYDYIYWMGCQTSYDPADKTIAKSLLKLLVSSGLKVAVLPEENCCGEPARRIGDELMFKELVNMNKELLGRYSFDKLLVNCPHGYNVFKYEYPYFGVELDVVHHSQLLAELISKGQLTGLNSFDENVTYHDPCYLGRWNNVYEEPREVIKKVVGDKLIEMNRSREQSFCCGGGGGHLFFEIKRGERISRMRTDEAISTGAKRLCVACPFCKIMLKSEAGDDIEVIDIAELLDRSRSQDAE